MKKSFNLFTVSDWLQFLQYVLNLNEGKYPWIEVPNKLKLTVTIQKYRKKRSLTANAYYWSVCIPTLAEYFGYRNDEMHTAILGTYTGWEERIFRGHTLFVPRRTSTTPEVMDTMDFAALIQTAQQIGAEEGIIFPDQEEQSATKNNS